MTASFSEKNVTKNASPQAIFKMAQLTSSNTKTQVVASRNRLGDPKKSQLEFGIV
ncbi:hypothetical protein K2P97_06730 [bacterium]|nr:hypothetical protein [bacterium]